MTLGPVIDLLPLTFKLSSIACFVEMNLNSASFLPVGMLLTFVGRGRWRDIEGRVFLGSKVLAGQVAAAYVASSVPRLFQLSAAWTVPHYSRGSHSRMLPLRYFPINNFSWHSRGQISGKLWVSWGSAECKSSLVRSGAPGWGALPWVILALRVVVIICC